MSWAEDLVAALEAAKTGGRGAAGKVVREYMEMTGKSPQQLYRIAGEHGYKPDRKKRADSGECVLTDLQISWISAQIHTTRREVKGAITQV